jgi:hypothetical protein
MYSEPLATVVPDHLIIDALTSVTGKRLEPSTWTEELDRALDDDEMRDKLVHDIQSRLAVDAEDVKLHTAPSTLTQYEWPLSKELSELISDPFEPLGTGSSWTKFDPPARTVARHFISDKHIVWIADRLSPTALGFEHEEWKPYAPTKDRLRVLRIVNSALDYAHHVQPRWFHLFRSNTVSEVFLRSTCEEAGKVELALGSDSFDLVYLADGNALYLVFFSAKKPQGSRHVIDLDSDPRKLYEVVVEELNGRREIVEVTLKSIQKAIGPNSGEEFSLL